MGYISENGRGITMKVIRNEWKAIHDRWEDPGDYPSNAGQFALPPGPWQVAGMEGDLVVELDDHETAELCSAISGNYWRDWCEATVDELDEPLPDGILRVPQWGVEMCLIPGKPTQIKLWSENETVEM